MFASHANEILRDRQTIQFIDEFLQYVTQLPNTFVIDANTLQALSLNRPVYPK